MTQIELDVVIFATWMSRACFYGDVDIAMTE